MTGRDDYERDDGPARIIRDTLSTWSAAYSQIYFSRDFLSGLLFCAATFVDPWHGISGLLGVILANGTARLIGRPAGSIEDGFYGFNGLLTGLALGLYFRPSVQFALLLVLAVGLVVVLATALRNLSERYLGLPVLSLPFVLATWTALLATRRFSTVEIAPDLLSLTRLSEGHFPEIVELYLWSLGASFFQFSVLSGALVLAGLLWFSRWAVFLSIIGFASGYTVYTTLGGIPSDLHVQFIGFNFILTAIAVGGIWIVLSPASMVYAAAGAALSAMLSAGLLALARPYGLPVLAMPFIAATQLMLFAILIRTGRGALRLVRVAPSSPESNLSRSLYRTRRYPDPSVPAMFLPVTGSWLITQGPGGGETHTGLWSHAWDFEIEGEEGRTFRNQGASLEDYYAYNAPVFAPGDARVVRIVDHLDDNPVGEVDTANNWGNMVILWHSDSVYSALCHLKKGSIQVKEGEMVTTGRLIGRVGNSGRSPVPHLHFQLQSSATIGAPTLYGEFLHYLTTAAEPQPNFNSLTQALSLRERALRFSRRPCADFNAKSVDVTMKASRDRDAVRYVTHGLPGQDTVVTAMTVEETVRRALTLAPGRRWAWSVNREGRRTRETWRSDIDALGSRSLVADGDRRESARLSFFTDSHYTTMLDYKGSSKQLLGLMYLGLPRVPFLDDERIAWSDDLAPDAFLNPVANLAREILLPFVETITVRTRSRLSCVDGRVIVSTALEVDSALGAATSKPGRIEIEFAPGIGPVAIRAFRDDRAVLTAELNG